MGLFSSFDEFSEGVDTGFFGLPSITESIEGFTGKTGAEAALSAAAIQARETRAGRELFTPIVEAGIAQIPELARGATAEGFGENIGDILQGGALDPLIAQRKKAAEAEFSARGLRRSGAGIQEAANIPADLALQIEGELNRRRQSIAGQGQTGAGKQAGLSNMIGQALAGGQLGAAESMGQGQENIGKVIGAVVGAFSDERLKTDIVVVDEIGGLPVIDWAWNDVAFAKFGLEGRSVGFSAQDVEKRYPEFVHEHDGIKKIDYDSLLGELKNGSH